MDTLNGLVRAKDLLGSPVRRLIGIRHKRVGSPPGTLEYTGPSRSDPVVIQSMGFDSAGVEESALESGADFKGSSPRDLVTWINVDGLNDLDLMREIGDAFRLHPLVMEDLVHTGQRPKMEDYDHYLFVVFRMLSAPEGGGPIHSEQVGIIIGERFVLSFQERAGDVWEPVRERVRGGRGRIRGRGADYLAYALMDAIVDNYFKILEDLANRAEELEAEVLSDPTQATMHRIHDLRQELLVVRRAVWPLRELTSSLLRTESSVIQEETGVFLRDVSDHTVQVIDMAETLRDVVSSLMDLYLSSVSNRMNEIMKVLTIMASIFIPLTFLAGIYGMNFQYMPELGLPWAYPVLLATMVVLGGGLLIFFRRKGWF